MAEYSSKKIAYHHPAKPSAGLFDRIILAIQREKELRQGKKILTSFVFLLFFSCATIPFSFILFTQQWQKSEIFYFIYTALENLRVFFSLWQDFLLSIVEALPITGTILFAINLALFVFTIRLFLHKKNLLFKYLLK